MDYNKLQQDRDSERRSGARVVRRWTESELQLMAAMDVMAEREKRKRARCYIATSLGRPLDSVSGKRRESTYKVLVDRVRAVHSDILSALIRRELKCFSSRRDTPTLSEPDLVSDSAGPANVAPTTRDEGNGLGAPNREVTPTAQADGRRPWSDAELDIITKARPTTKTKEHMKLLPGRTAIAIRSKRLRLKSAVSAPPLPPQSRVVTSGPANRPGKDPPSAAPERADLDMISHTNTARVLTPDEIEGLCRPPAAADDLSLDQTVYKLNKIKAYILGILNDTKHLVEPEFVVLAKQVMDGATSLRQLYAYILPKKYGLKKGRGGPRVRPGLTSRRYQKAEVYKYLKKTYKYSPKTVAEKILNGTASYDDLSRREGFRADDFVKAWRPIFERTDRDCTIPALNVRDVRWDLIEPIKISEVADALKRTKNSSLGPDGYRFKEILSRPIEQIAVLLNLIMLYGPE